MKQYIYILITCLLLLSCSEDYDESLGLYPTLTPRYLSVSPIDMSFPTSLKSSQELTIKSIQTPWAIDNSISWISLSSTLGNTDALVDVITEENTVGDESRVGVFYFRGNVEEWSFESPISISQAGAQPIVELSQYDIDFSGAENSSSVTVTANCIWSAISSSNWLTATTNKNTINITVAANASNSYRTANIVVAHKGNINIDKNLIVRQAPASINASSDIINFNNTAGSATITITSESSWTAKTSDSWINIAPTSGDAGTSDMVVDVAPNKSINERSGFIILSIGGEKRIQIPIIQKGIYLETIQSSINFEASGGSSILNVESNTSWSISSKPNWITITPTNGKDNKELIIVASENPNTANRSGVIIISQEGVSLNVSVDVSQKGKTFDVANTVLNFEDKASTQSVQIETDGKWIAHTSTDWITLSSSSAVGDFTLDISVKENKSNGERNGNVVITMGDKSISIAVIQKGKYFTVSNSLLTYTSKGGGLNVSISTNDNWTAEIDKIATSWLTLSKASGDSNVDVKITATDNPSVNSRSANVYFTTVNSQSVRVLVNQDARFLTVDMQEVLFYSKGGKSDVITISTDGTYSLSTKESWLTINQSENTFTLTATENKTLNPRTGVVIITLTDLIEGSYSLELNVTQLNYGGTFLRKGYGDEQDWDSVGNSNGNFFINTFDDDKDYDTNPDSSGKTTLKITYFNADKNWDTTSSSQVTVKIDGFKPDKDLDTDLSSGGAISYEGFEDDKKWN